MQEGLILKNFEKGDLLSGFFRSYCLELNGKIKVENWERVKRS